MPRIKNPCIGGSIPPRATKMEKGLASAKPFLRLYPNTYLLVGLGKAVYIDNERQCFFCDPSGIW
jgi:hypothetical protein